MKTKLLSFLLVLVTSGGVSGADALTETFQKGLFEEEANRNLDAAIQAYQSVLKQLDAQRRIAATTVFRLGECYRKLGQTNEAAAQYQRILREFTDQEILAKLSRQNLTALGQPDDPSRKRIDLLTVPVVNEEQAEIERIRGLIANSPDLINISGKDGLTPLQKAAQSGHLAVARFLLQSGADVEAKGNFGRPPLLYAAEAGNKSMVELLLAHKADLNAAAIGGTGETALHIAVRRGYRVVAESLFAARANPNAQRRLPPGNNLLDSLNTTPLHDAIFRNDRNFVELLLAHGADVSLSSGEGVTALHHWAARGASVEIGAALLQKGAKPNATIRLEVFDNIRPDRPGTSVGPGTRVTPGSENLRTISCQGFTPLHLAAGHDSTEAVRLLLSSGANVNAKASSDRTPLNLAAAYANVETVRALLEKGAEVNAVATDDTSFPLHMAVARRMPDLVELILARKPNLELRNSNGLTPLLRAVNNSDVAIMKNLLDAGADPNAPGPSDARHKTVLHYAVEMRNRAMVEVLLEHKANVVAVDANGKTPLDYVSGGSGPPNPARPTRVVPPSTLSAIAMPSAAQTAEPASTTEIASLLRKAGGKDDLHRLTSIRIGRRGNFYPIFLQTTNNLNRYALFELIASFYRTQASIPGPYGAQMTHSSPLPFPDFGGVVIRRLSQDGETPVKIDAEAAFQVGDCSKNTWLEWGDVVEIPEADHALNATWNGLPVRTIETLRKCLTRTVRIVVKGQATEAMLNLSPLPLENLFQNRLQAIGMRASNAPPAIGSAPPSQPGQPAAPPPATPPKPDPLKIDSFRLKEVLYASNLLLTSSDLTRVKVTRVDPASGEKKEMVLNLEQTETQSDLWLRDGDVIEVPEKP